METNNITITHIKTNVSHTIKIEYNMTVYDGTETGDSISVIIVPRCHFTPYDLSWLCEYLLQFNGVSINTAIEGHYDFIFPITEFKITFNTGE